ncbi:unnamed protein product [Pleuronectes platessa]|uniref:Uncharacterized protein n=1 Tax=Pleuronectes platessa TaxID=8262 RepID=A0A9N7YT07_PLEPL|nr:unnamed protein product [Pleuronectes platessa]
MEGCQIHIWPLGEGGTEEKERGKSVLLRQSWRTDRPLGKAFCHMKTPPPLNPSPVIQAFSVKDARTGSTENHGSRLITEQGDGLRTGGKRECPDNCPTESSYTCCDAVAISSCGREMF